VVSFASTNSTVIWTTTSVHGNEITLYEEAWKHILEHPEMYGQEEIVRKAVEQPIRVREGLYPDCCAFEIQSSTNPEGVRVFVRHDTEIFLSGGVTGSVTTAYPIQTSKFKSRVGPIIGTYPPDDGNE
jgi:hypothetical protein